MLPPPPPWTLRLAGVVWLHRARPGAGRAHQPGLRFDRAVPLTVAGLVDYAESPVGPYAEVWGAPTLVLRGATVGLGIPFMAVDSAASMAGGRANWALPKTLASFAGDAATGPGWSLRARAASAGVRLPFAVAGRLLQVREGGHELLRATALARGVGRLARVDVETTGDVPGWLAGGRHAGLLIERGALVVRRPIASRP
jgi:hypothetical protein